MVNLNEGAKKQLKKRISELECDLIKILVKNEDFLLPKSAILLRWAFSLARLSKVKVEPKPYAEYILVDDALDRYRAQFFAIISNCLTPNGFDQELLERACLVLEALCKKELNMLLSLFRDLSKEALDLAISKRPLALILGGGGGSGYVYAGAFFALEDAGITPSIISGSSMGSILGAYRARLKHFSFEALNSLVAKTTWSKVAQAFLGQTRFGIPATFRLYLREVIGQEFLKNSHYMALKDLEIPFRVCVSGLSSSYNEKEEEFQKFAHLFEAEKGILEIKAKHPSIIKKILEFAQKPLKPVYLGGDDLTKDFDVIDAMGFSSAIPGVFYYDMLRNDLKMEKLIKDLMLKEKVSRFIDGGFSDNMPSIEAIKASDEGALEGFDPFVLALDSFSLRLSKHLIFYPLMLFAMEKSKKGHELANFSIRFSKVLSPVHFVPTKESFLFAVTSGYEEIKPHLSFIRKMLGPIPRLKFI